MSNRKFTLFLSVLIAIGATLILFLRDDLEPVQTSAQITQIEITKPIRITAQTLLSGQANGYTHNQDLIILDHYPAVFPSYLSYFDRFRVKMWDYFYIVTEKHILAFSINQVMNFGSALLLIYEHERMNYKIQHQTMLSLSEYELPPYAYSHSVNANFKTSEVNFDFKSPSKTKKIIELKRLHYFEAKFEFTYKEDHHSITTVNPASEDNRVNFSFGSKVYCIEVKGNYTYRENYFEVKRAVAMHDHGRGTPPYKTMWVWGSLNGILPDGRLLGANFGTGDKPGINFTTDALFIDGVMHKLGVVNVFFNTKDVLKEKWVIITMSEAPKGSKAKLYLEFSPAEKAMNGKNYLVVKVDLLQVFGHFKGELMLSDGEIIMLNNFPGFMERNYARW